MVDEEQAVNWLKGLYFKYYEYPSYTFFTYYGHYRWSNLTSVGEKKDGWANLGSGVYRNEDFDLFIQRETLLYEIRVEIADLLKRMDRKKQINWQREGF